MAKIDKKMSFGELIRKYPETSRVFQKYGMHCVGCMASMFETIEEGANVHGINVDKLIKDLNKVIRTKPASKTATKNKTKRSHPKF